MAKILVTTSTFPRWQDDSVPPMVLNLSLGLANNGHEVYVLAPHARGAALEEQLGPLHVYRFRYAPARWEVLCYDGGMEENLKRRPLAWALVPFFLAAESFAMLRLARKHDVDLVQAHWFLPQGLVAAIVRPIIQRPLMITAHGADIFATKGFLRRLMFSIATKAAGAVTVNSAAMLEAFSRLSNRHAAVIPSGVNTTRFCPAPVDDSPATSALAFGATHPDEASEHPEGPRLLFVGRLAEKKGVKYLIQALPAILAASPRATLTLVGYGPERSALDEEVRRLGVEEHVVFAGPVANERLPEYYRAADVFVAPSVVSRSGDTEALGVVMLEAAACGVPIVASNVGGIGDIVRNEETGLLVRPGSSDDLAHAILRLAGDASFRQHLAHQAREHVVREFSWDSVAGRYEDLFKNLTLEAAPGRA